MCDIALDDFAFMDIWGHFYSALDENKSAYYVNLLRYA